MNIGLQVAGPPPARVWRFGTAEFDESRQELRVGGRPCPVEAKPLALLLRAGEVAGKAELMEAIWPDVTVVENSLPTAVSKLRQALGPEGQTIIEAVPQVGYRIGVPIELGAARPLARLALSLCGGDAVPGRPDWRLQRALGRGGSRWLAVQAGSGARHVFSFADKAEHLDLLRSEAAAGMDRARPGAEPGEPPRDPSRYRLRPRGTAVAGIPGARAGRGRRGRAD